MNVKSPDDLSDLEKLALIKLSYSRLNTYDMCEAMYFYSYIQKEPQVFGPAATLGNVIHAVLEDTVGEPLVYSELKERYEYHLLQYDPDNLIEDKLREAGDIMIGEFVDRHEDEVFNVISKEHYFEMVIGSALIRGYIDLVMRNPNGDMVIIDYKSGSWEVSQKDVSDNLQLGIYALAMFIQNPHLEEFYAELYYLRSGRRKGHTFTREDLESVYQRILDKTNEIINKNNFHPLGAKKPGYPPCNFCDFATPELCKIGSITKEKMAQRRAMKKRARG